MQSKIKFHSVSVVSLIIGIFIMSLALAPTSAFSADPKEELKNKGIAFNADSFVQQAKKGNLEDVKLFLNAGMDVNINDKYGVTALIFASEGGHTDMVKLLLKNGADVPRKVKRAGRTP